MKIGFIGGWGHHYLKGLFPSDALHAAVAADGVDDAAARRFIDKLPGATWYADPTAMLDQFKPDFLSVGSIYAHNVRWVLEGLKRDIPTVSDKPIASTWEQLQQVRSLLAGTGRILVTEFDFRARPEFRAARKAVLAGWIGTPILATAQKSYKWGTRPAWYADRSQYGGTLMWIASHGLDAIWFVTSKRIVAATGQGGNLSQPNYGTAEDHTVSLLELEGGGSGVVHADFLRPAKASTHGDDRLRVIGSGGVVEVRDGRCTLITHDHPERDITSEATSTGPAREMLAALQGETFEYYGTHASLEMATVLLAARDAADHRNRIPIPR